MGYSAAELDDVQARWGLRFPPDLIALLKDRRPLFEARFDERSSFDWLLTDPKIIQKRLDWPFESFWFDVEHNNSWWPEWGEKPATLEEQRLRLKKVFAKAPRLIPLFSHRYIPEEPFETGNPILSVYQTDVIYYGSDLKDWIEREQDDELERPWGPIKEIRFWSEAVRKNHAEPRPTERGAS